MSPKTHRTTAITSADEMKSKFNTYFDIKLVFKSKFSTHRSYAVLFKLIKNVGVHVQS